MFPSGRRTIHDYTPDPVDEGALERAFAAAQEAPCHRLTWPWRFTRVGPQTRQALVDLNLRVKGEKRALSDEVRAKITRRMRDPELVVVSQVRCDDPMRSKEDYAAVACAIQNFSLSLHTEGIGTKWGTGAITRHPEAYGLVGVDPSAEEIVGFLFVGHPAVVPEAPVRPPLDEVVRRLP